MGSETGLSDSADEGYFEEGTSQRAAALGPPPLSKFSSGGVFAPLAADTEDTDNSEAGITWWKPQGKGGAAPGDLLVRGPGGREGEGKGVTPHSEAPPGPPTGSKREGKKIEAPTEEGQQTSTSFATSSCSTAGA